MEKSKNKSKKGSSIKFAVIFLILLIGIGAYFAQNYYKKSLGPVTFEDHKEITIEIPSGSSTAKIADILYDNGLIINKIIFRYVAKNMEADSSLKAGKYNLNTGMDLEELIKVLSKGTKNENTVRFTIPEGFEIKQVAEKLSEEGIIDAERFLELVSSKKNFEDKFAFLKELDEDQSLEGFLFPSTYEIYKDSSEEVIIEKMLAEFEKIYNKDVAPKLDEMDMTLNEVVTLASIVEREGKLDSERPLMSAVFHNRLDIEMPLQSCATVQYILGERKEVLTNEDTSTPSPYNTYIHKGLPPGPIASPGEASLIAAVNPADVDYLFFVLTGEDGSHTFTTNYNDHLNAKPKK